MPVIYHVYRWLYTSSHVTQAYVSYCVVFLTDFPSHSEGAKCHRNFIFLLESASLSSSSLPWHGGLKGATNYIKIQYFKYSILNTQMEKRVGEDFEVPVI